MAEYVDFHYMPLEGKITGKQVLKQTEDAINDLGQHVYEIDIDNELIQEAIDTSDQAIDTAEAALSAVTTNRAMWFNTVAEMKATDIALGITAATRGKDVFNDGDGAFYAVRAIKGGDVDSDDTVFLDNGNVAERIKQFNLIAKGYNINIIYVTNIAELRASDAVAGLVYGTTGYYSFDDGGAGMYVIRAATVSDVDNGGNIIILDNGNVAELIVDNGKVNIKQFGAYGDNSHDDTDAIVACANYCSANNKILYSDKSHYKTTASCIISMVKQVELNGAFDYLELRFARTQANSNWQRIYRVENLLILRDYKYTYFQVGYAKEVQIIADYAFSSGSSFAYCAFYGGYYETLSLVGGATGGWINDNSFFHTKLNTLNIGVGGSYNHNNNRFYDATLEGGTINFDRAQNNYVSCRAEGGVTINKTGYSANNIVERMYLASQGALRSAGWTFNANNLYLNHFYKYLKRYEILHLDINNLAWSENHDFANSIAYIKAWNGDGASTSLGNATIKFESDIVLYFYGNGQRASFVLLDENGDPVPKTVEDVVDTNNFSYNSTSYTYSISTNIQDGNYGINAYITYNSSTTIKYIQVRMSQGNSASKVISCGAFVLSGRNCAIVQKSKQRCVSKVKPIQTTSVPVNFEVINIGTNTAIWKWVYDGTAWQTCLWASATTPPYTPPSSSSAPSTGTHEVGEIVYNNAPTAGGTVGWVCVTAGTPGTWKAFGTIEA